MSQKNYFTWSGFIFLIVAVVHLLRAVNGWDLTISDFDVPMWASWVAVVVAGSLAYHALKKK